jgi:hypothetical protein
MILLRDTHTGGVGNDRIDHGWNRMGTDMEALASKLRASTSDQVRFIGVRGATPSR